MTALQRKSFLIQKQDEMVVWEHRNGQCYWGKLNCFDTALWHLFVLDLKQETKLSWFSPFVSNPVWELMFSSLPAAVNYSPLLLLNSAITLLKSAKCFGYSLYVGCCTKSSCVSVTRYNESTFKSRVFFSVTSVCKFGSLWVHHVDTTFYFALIFTYNFILCVVISNTFQDKYLESICIVIDTQTSFIKLCLCLPQWCFL